MTQKQKNDGSQETQGGFNSGFNSSNFGGTGFNNNNGEFNSGFGGTNAVSQIFKDAAFGENDKKKKIIIVSAALAAVVVSMGSLFYFFENQEVADTSFEPAPLAPPAEIAPPAVETAVTDSLVSDPAAIPEPVDSMTSAPLEVPGAGAPVQSMGGESTHVYNEEEGGVTISATQGATIEVARDESFTEMYVVGQAKGGQFRIPNPPPGKIFWREQGGSVNTVIVEPPPSLGLSFSAPATVSSGSPFSWSGADKAAFYRVEFATDNSFSNVAAVLSTSKTSIAPSGVSPGQYFVRLGGFNRQSGKWEFTRGTSVNVQ